MKIGFQKGRFIGENMRLNDYIISFCEIKTVLEMLLFVDFEKAFDTLECLFLQKHWHISTLVPRCYDGLN